MLLERPIRNQKNDIVGWQEFTPTNPKLAQEQMDLKARGGKVNSAWKHVRLSESDPSAIKAKEKAEQGKADAFDKAVQERVDAQMEAKMTEAQEKVLDALRQKSEALDAEAERLAEEKFQQRIAAEAETAKRGPGRPPKQPETPTDGGTETPPANPPA